MSHHLSNVNVRCACYASRLTVHTCQSNHAITRGDLEVYILRKEYHSGDLRPLPGRVAPRCHDREGGHGGNSQGVQGG